MTDVLIPKKFMTPPIVTGTDGIRRFNSMALQAQVEKVYASLPPGQQAAVIEIGVDQQGIVLAGAVNIGKGFSLMGAFEHRVSGEWSGQASLRWTPPVS